MQYVCCRGQWERGPVSAVREVLWVSLATAPRCVVQPQAGCFCDGDLMNIDGSWLSKVFPHPQELGLGQEGDSLPACPVSPPECLHECPHAHCFLSLESSVCFPLLHATGVQMPQGTSGIRPQAHGPQAGRWCICKEGPGPQDAGGAFPRLWGLEPSLSLEATSWEDGPGPGDQPSVSA